MLSDCGGHAPPLKTYVENSGGFLVRGRALSEK